MDVKFIYHYDTKSIDVIYEHFKLYYEYKTNYLLLFNINDDTQTSKLFMYDITSNTCLYGNCKKYKNDINNFKENYYKMLKN